MKRTRVVASLLFLLSLPVPALADYGFNVAWNDCIHGTGVTTKAFACDTDVGSHAVIVSVVPPVDVGLWTGFACEVSVNSTSSTLPNWWRLRNQTGQLGQCRAGSIGANASADGLSGCLDPYEGQGAGGVATYQVAPNGQAYKARVLLGFAVPQGQERPLTQGEEYFVAKIVINNAKTTGVTGCAGCPQGACILGEYVEIAQPYGAPGGDTTVGFHDFTGSAGVGWQNAQVQYSDCGIGCWEPGKPSLANCAICPTVQATWGQVKAIYR